ncbi:MAG TPA: hypothetical protein VHE12_04555 [bacterium]|nr:hypothetical protein [bacterium]
MAFKIPSAVPRSQWTQGLSTLSKLWQKGLLPDDLRRHYFLHWFVTYQGNIIQTAKALDIHRNTIQGHFLDLGYSKRSVKLRHAWQVLTDRKGADFKARFNRFYVQVGRRPQFSPAENSALVDLWQIKFPFKTLTPHYLLWAIRSKKPKDWVQRKLGYSYRHRARLLSHVLRPKSRDGFWLSPLRPKVEEVYSRRYRTVLSRRKGR